LESAEIIQPLTSRQRNQIWAARAILNELDDLDARIHIEFRNATNSSH